MMKIPLGIKVLAVFFFLFVVWYIVSSLGLVVMFETTGKTPEEIGRLVGISLRTIFLLFLNLFAGIGLLRLKKWGLICSSTSLIIEGIFFAINFGIGFAKGAGTESIVVKTAAMGVAFLVIGTIVTLLIIYMKKKLKENQFIISPAPK